MNKKDLHNFLKENRKSFPNYFRINELKAYYEQKKLYIITVNKLPVGFYVVNETQFKSLFIKKEYRGGNLINQVMKHIQENNSYLTIAINKNSKRMIKFCKKFNFKETNKKVQGKTYNLTIYEYNS